MLIEMILFLVGLVLLVKGSDYFVKSSSTIARQLGVSEFIIGLTLVSIGTSLPELASAIASALNGSTGLFLGNVIGANIANIGLITGVAVMFRNIKIRREMFIRDGAILFFVIAIFIGFILDSTISRIEAGIFVFLYLVYLLFLVESKNHGVQKQKLSKFAAYFFRFRYLATIRKGIVSRKKNLKKNNSPIWKDLFILILAGGAIAFGAKYFIGSSIYFARIFSVPESLIGLTLIALGTTLPELSVSVSAARRGLGGIAIGNVLGSCIVNILLILGVSSLITPAMAPTSLVLISALLMFLITSLFLLFIRTGRILKKKEGFVLFGMYVLIVGVMIWLGRVF